MRVARVIAAAAAALACAVARADAPGLPTVGAAPPSLSLPDAAGKTHTLAELRGRTVALAFFCGCDRCRAVAQLWGTMQQSGGIVPGRGAQPSTVVVFMGDAAAMKDFSRQTGLAPGTMLLSDAAMRATAAYHAEPCPRMFVLDRRGVVRYVNGHKDDDPMSASAVAITARVVDALRSASAPAAKHR